MSKQNKKMLLFAILTTISMVIIFWIGVALHEMGHYISASFFGVNPSIKYGLSQYLGNCHCDAVGGIESTIIQFSGGLFAAAVFALLWICAFSFEREEVSPLNYSIIVVCLIELLYGIEEGFVKNYAIFLSINTIISSLIVIGVLLVCRKKIILWIDMHL